MSALSQIQVGSTVYDIQAIEYIVGTQTSATLDWTGVTESSSLEVGKVIAYKLPYAASNNLGRCSLNLTLSGGGTTGAKDVIDANNAAQVPHKTSAPDQIVNKVYLLIYDGTQWQYLGGGAGGSNGEIVTTSENFVKTVTATTTTLSVASVNGTELIIGGGGTVVSGITTTTGSAITAVDNDSNVANAYGEYF